MADYVIASSPGINPLIQALGLTANTTKATIHLDAQEFVRMTTERLLTQAEVEALTHVFDPDSEDGPKWAFVKESTSYTLSDGTQLILS